VGLVRTVAEVAGEQRDRPGGAFRLHAARKLLAHVDVRVRTLDAPDDGWDQLVVGATRIGPSR
jgi:hypothetical protein